MILLLNIGLLIFPHWFLQSRLHPRDLRKMDDPLLLSPLWDLLYILCLFHLSTQNDLPLKYPNIHCHLSSLIHDIPPFLFRIPLILLLNLELFLFLPHISLASLQLLSFCNMIPLSLLFISPPLIMFYPLYTTCLPDDYHISLPDLSILHCNENLTQWLTVLWLCFRAVQFSCCCLCLFCLSPLIIFISACFQIFYIIKVYIVCKYPSCCTFICLLVISSFTSMLRLLSISSRMHFNW